MAATYTLTRTIAADEPYDLVVAGGGPAGEVAIAFGSLDELNGLLDKLGLKEA